MAVHYTINGDPIAGLMRLKDGRWRASGPAKYTFTEKDEGRAIAHFFEWKAKQEGETIHVPIAAARVGKPDEVRQAMAAVIPPKPPVEKSPKEQFLDWLGPSLPPDPSAPPATGTPVTISADGDRLEFYGRPVNASAFWPWLARLILDHGKLCARKTGIEELGWLKDTKKPTPSPTLREVGEAYFTRNDITEKEANRCKTAWSDFCKAVGVEVLRDLTPELVANFGQKVKKEKQAAKTIYHHFNRVKTVLNHFRTTGRAIDDVRRALDCCAVLKAPETTSLDPHPIGRKAFEALLAKAEEGEEKALLLTALNLCFYPVDIARLKWDELDVERGVYQAKRGKTKVARCAVLWPRTVEALKKLARVEDDEHVFHKEDRRPHTDTTVRKWFWKLRERAGVGKDVQFADIRDGSFTEAVAGDGVEFQHAQVLAGHRSGIADAYVRRNPKMTAKACAAVEAAYFGDE